MSQGVYRVKKASHTGLPLAVRHVGGLELHVDRPAGTEKTWELPDGKITKKYPVDYGYLPGHKGEDGEPLDFFVGSNAEKGWHGSFHKRKPIFDEHGARKGFANDETKFFTGLTPEEHAEVLKMFDGPTSGLITNHRFFGSLPGLQGALVRHRDTGSAPAFASEENEFNPSDYYGDRFGGSKFANAMIRRMMHFEDLAGDKSPAMSQVAAFAKARLDEANRVIPKPIKPLAKVGPVRGVPTPVGTGKFASQANVFLKTALNRWQKELPNLGASDLARMGMSAAPTTRAAIHNAKLRLFRTGTDLNPAQLDRHRTLNGRTQQTVDRNTAGLRERTPIPNAQRQFTGLLSGVRNDSALVPSSFRPKAASDTSLDQILGKLPEVPMATNVDDLAAQAVSTERTQNRLMGAVQLMKLLGVPVHVETLKTAHRANPFGRVQGPDWLQHDEDHEFDAAPDFWKKK